MDKSLFFILSTVLFCFSLSLVAVHPLPEMEGYTSAARWESLRLLFEEVVSSLQSSSPLQGSSLALSLALTTHNSTLCSVAQVSTLADQSYSSHHRDQDPAGSLVLSRSRGLSLPPLIVLTLVIMWLVGFLKLTFDKIKLLLYSICCSTSSAHISASLSFWVSSSTWYFSPALVFCFGGISNRL